jgi:hypothetical protein
MTNDFLYFENQYSLYFTEPKDVSDIKLINIHISKLPNKDELENITNKVYKDFFENLYEEIKNGKIDILSKYIRFPWFVSVPGNYSTIYIEIIFYNEFENLFETNEKYIEYVKYLLNNLKNSYNGYISHFILYNFVKSKNKKYLDLFLNLFYTNKMKNPIKDINSHRKEHNKHIFIDKIILELIKSYNLYENKNIFLLKIFNNFDFHESNNIIYGNFEEWNKKYEENKDKEFLCCLFDSLSVFPEITIEIINNNKKIFEKFFKKGIFSEYFNKSLFIENIDLFEIKEHEKDFNGTFFKKLKSYDNKLLELIVNKLQS